MGAEKSRKTAYILVDLGRAMVTSIPVRILVLFLVFLASQTWAGSEPPDFILQWGSIGGGDGQFHGMHGIEIDAEGNVYVVDTGNNR